MRSSIGTGEEENYSRLNDEDLGRLAPSREYYWILAVEQKSGRPIILGAYSSEEQANQVGFEKIDGSFEVVQLPTRDAARANKMLKYRRFAKTARLEEAVKRAKHEKGLDRDREKEGKL